MIDDIHGLVAAIDIEDIVVHEERARRISWSKQPEEFPEPSVSLGIKNADSRLRYRFRMVLADQVAEYVADYEAVYLVSDDAVDDISEELVSEFAEKVAFMTVYPYLRASLFAGAARLGSPRPVLGIVRQGDMGPSRQLTEDEVRSTFFENRTELE